MSAIILGATFRNSEVLVRQLSSAFETWVKEDIDEAYWDDQFRDMGLWDYGRETRRRNGEIVDSPRDIYDMGTLYESGKDSTIESSVNAIVANWSWDARGDSGYQYARDVHEGEGTSNGFPRPWTDELAVPQKFANSAVRKALIGRVQAALNTR